LRYSWANEKHAQTTNISNHLRLHPNWAERCQQHRIEPRLVTEKDEDDVAAVQDQPLNKDGILFFLLRWLIVSDLVSLFPNLVMRHVSLTHADTVGLTATYRCRHERIPTVLSLLCSLAQRHRPSTSDKGSQCHRGTF
jgi:hypothetical protein